MSSALAQAWRATWTALGGFGDGARALDDLCARYAQPHRAYHTLAHITHCLRELAAVRALAIQPHVAEAAIWFHDAVYDPRASDNEELSAQLAETTLRNAGVPAATCARVATLVQTTKDHVADPTDMDGLLINDVDLAILGQAPAAFDRYELEVRREFEWVPDSAFRSGRARLLRELLARPVIYATEPLRVRYEVDARSNLARSLARLTNTG